MTTHSFARAMIATALFATGGSVLAAGNTTVQVTATISAVCQFKAATMAAIPLGTIDPSAVAAAVTGTSDITYKCTTGTVPTVTIDSGGTTLTAGAKTIPYSFTLGSAAAGTGFSTAGSAKVVGTASIALTDAQDAQAGSYSDTVTLSINY